MSLQETPASETTRLNKGLFLAVGITLTIILIGLSLLIADYFYPVVALLCICLVLTYMLLFPVRLMEQLITWASQQFHRISAVRDMTRNTPTVNPRILAVFIVYFVFIMTVTLSFIRYVPVLSKDIRGFGDAITSYTNQMTVDAINWAENTFGSQNVRRVLLDSSDIPTIRSQKYDSPPTPANPDAKMTPQEKQAVQRSLIETTTNQGLGFLIKGLNSAIIHAVDLATGTLMGLVYCISGFLLIFYFLLDGKRLANNFTHTLPTENQETARFFLSHFHQVMDAFIRGQVLLGICTGIYMFTVYSFFGVPYALLLGVVMAIAECLPVVGTWIGITPAIIVMLFTFGPGKTAFIWLFSYAYQTVKDNIIAPKIVGDTMGLHPLVVILSLLICAHFAGFLGVLLALPIASILKVILEYFVQLENKRLVPAPVIKPSEDA